MLDRQKQVLMQNFRLLPSFLQQHSRAVGAYAEHLAGSLARMGKAELLADIPEPVLKEMRLIAGCHDIGKAAIPADIWHSSEPLNGRRWSLVKAHPLLGAQMIRGKVLLPEQETAPADILTGAAQCCQYHHERWDGQGYPFGLCGEEIPVLARVAAIADAYDAMRADRPYQRAVDRETALENISQNAGRQFDPLLVEVFIQSMHSTAAVARG